MTKKHKYDNTIIKYLNANLASIDIETFETFIPELLTYFTPNIQNALFKIYQGKFDSLNRQAFEQEVRDTFRKCFNSYKKKEYYKDVSRCFGKYLNVALSYKTKDFRNRFQGHKVSKSPICPACKYIDGNISHLSLEGSGANNYCNCNICTHALTELPKNHKHYALRNTFAHHKRTGVGCPKCNAFIPYSHVHDNQTYCVFCNWFGQVKLCHKKEHPVVNQYNELSLNYKVTNNIKVFLAGEVQNIFDFDTEHLNKAHVDLEHNQSLQILYTKILKEIDRQIRIIESKTSSFKKMIMFKAFRSMLVEDKINMIAYLSGNQIRGERPIQSQIWQRFVQILENHLPYALPDGSTAYSLLDDGVNVFLGKSEYKTYVINGTIPNATHETFFGKKCKGPCYIGYLLDVIDSNGKSVLNQIQYYQFNKIKTSLKDNTEVTVHHLRIPPHYEMGAMIHLQRCRKHLSVFIRKVK